MTTYLVVHIDGSWQLHSQEDHATMISTDIASEEIAIEMAMGLARTNRPSQVMRMAISGDIKLLSVLGVERENAGSETPKDTRRLDNILRRRSKRNVGIEAVGAG